MHKCCSITIFGNRMKNRKINCIIWHDAKWERDGYNGFVAAHAQDTVILSEERENCKILLTACYFFRVDRYSFQRIIKRVAFIFLFLFFSFTIHTTLSFRIHIYMWHKTMLMQCLARINEEDISTGSSIVFFLLLISEWCERGKETNKCDFQGRKTHK